MQLKAIRDYARRIAGSLPFAILMLVLASVFWCIERNVYGVLCFVMVLSLLLILCDDVTVTLLPFLLTCILATRCYDSFDTFMTYAPLAVIPIGALIFHFTVYHKKFSRGSSLYGIIAVAVAVTLGGLFTLPAEDYFSGTSLFYVGGLGIGMVATYFLLKSEYHARPDYNLRERVFASFYIAALFVFVIVINHQIIFSEWVANKGIWMQFSNNLSTLMMFFMPIPFYYALKKHRLHMIMGFLFYIAILLTGSRGGLVMGGIELLLCLAYVAYYDKPLRIPSIAIALFGAVAAVIIFINWFPIGSTLLSADEPRLRLMRRALEDFCANPVFGMGMGYQGNSDIYNPVKGAANWYHMLPFQIIGSFGLVGIAAYGYQYYGRFRLIFKNRSPSNLALGLSYIGVFLMSMVNPGEFCPVPYQLLAVLLLILLETPDDTAVTNAFLPLRRKKATAELSQE